MHVVYNVTIMKNTKVIMNAAQNNKKISKLKICSKNKF